ncbi:hypothetical protein VTJ83DRAFT_3943 [Remersonia thermophila]|uniref:Uncharacterized protein n=1 Tax=Remersonia thermophila TaxID=72144 RepID=A0ABR4DFQ6_9PEZI
MKLLSIVALATAALAAVAPVEHAARKEVDARIEARNPDPPHAHFHPHPLTLPSAAASSAAASSSPAAAAAAAALHAGCPSGTWCRFNHYNGSPYCI